MEIGAYFDDRTGGRGNVRDVGSLILEFGISANEEKVVLDNLGIMLEVEIRELVPHAVSRNGRRDVGVEGQDWQGIHVRIIDRANIEGDSRAAKIGVRPKLVNRLVHCHPTTESALLVNV